LGLLNGALKLRESFSTIGLIDRDIPAAHRPIRRILIPVPLLTNFTSDDMSHYFTGPAA